MIDGTLYRQGFLTPLLRCILKEEVEYVMSDVHEEVCENQLGGRSFTAKIMRAGYY